MATAWEFVRLKLLTKEGLAGLDESFWGKHVDWLLGPTVAKQEVKSGDGSLVYAPSWLAVLEYDLQVRAHAMDLVNTSHMSIKEAMIASRKSEEVRSMYFTSLVALSAGVEAARAEIARSTSASAATHSVRPAHPYDPSGDRVDAKGKGKVRGKGKGKGKTSKDSGKGAWGQDSGANDWKGGWHSGANKGEWLSGKGQANDGSWKSGLTTKTPDGRQKCFPFQRKAGCTRKDCDKIHACLVCNGPHGQHACPQKPAGGKP